MMRMKLLASVALASLAMPAFHSAALAQPIEPVGRSSDTPVRPPVRNSSSADDLIRQQNIAAAQAEQRRQADLAQRDDYRKSLDDDVAKRRLTAAQADEIYNGVIVSGSAVLSRVGSRAPAMVKGVSGSIQIAADRTGNQFTSDLNDPNFSQGMAETTVDLASLGIAMNQELIREIGPDLGKLLTVFADASQKRVDFMKANGTVPPLYIQNTQTETTRFKRIIVALPSRLDGVDFTLTKARTDLEVNRDKYVDKLKPAIEAKRSEMIEKYGPDASKWPKAPPPPPPKTAAGPRMNDDGTYGTPLPWEGQPASLPPTATPTARPPSGTSAASTGSTRTPSRGRVPPSDPYAGLRVSSAAGGTAAPSAAGAAAPKPTPAPQQGSAASRATQSASSSAKPATTQPKAPPKSSLNVPKTNIPTNTRTGENITGSTDLGIGATTRPSNQRTPVQSAASSAGAAGKAAKAPPKGSSAGASASSFTNAARVESQAGNTVYDPQVRGTDRPKPRNTIRVAAGFHGTGFIEVDMDEAIRQAAGKPSPPPKPLTQAERAEINNVLKGMPKNPDGSIDMAGGYNALIKGLPEALQNLFVPKPTGNAAQRSAAANAAAASAAQRAPTSTAGQRAPEPFVQPRQPGGPDYPLAPSRASRRAQQGAAQGQWTPGDSFGAAGAAATAAASTTPPDAVDLAMERIAAESSAAMEAWQRRADEVYYDENGVIHSVPRDRPENTYRRPPTPLRPVDDSAFGRFERGLGSLSILDLEPIYAGWNPDTAPVGLGGSRGPSSAGSVGPSSAGN